MNLLFDNCVKTESNSINYPSIITTCNMTIVWVFSCSPKFYSVTIQGNLSKLNLSSVKLISVILIQVELISFKLILFKLSSFKLIVS